MNDHPTIEDLSAAVDGEASPDVERHARGCDTCAATLARLEDVRRSVASAPGLTGAAVDRAIAVALEERVGAPASVVKMRRTTTMLRGLAAAAAVAAVVAVGAVVLDGAGTGGNDEAAVSSGAEEFADESTAADGAGALPEAAAGGGADSLSGARLRFQSVGELADHLAGGERLQPAPGPTADATAQGEFEGDGRGGAARTAAPGCADAAAMALGGTAAAEELYAEVIVWRDEDAVLFADFAQRRAVVMRPAGCAVLADLRF